jgi:hypothetical protein
MNGDGQQPRCDVVLCSRPANYHLPDRDGQLRYICDRHRPFASLMMAPFATVDRVVPLDDDDAAGWREMRAADEVDQGQATL